MGNKLDLYFFERLKANRFFKSVMIVKVFMERRYYMLEYAYFLLVNPLFGYIVYSLMSMVLFLFVIRTSYINRWQNIFLSHPVGHRDTLPIAVLIPNRNEATIDKTLQSIMGQTKKPEHVIIVFNNMTDNGYSYNLAQNILKHSSLNYTLLVMEDNPYLKSGALNFGYSWLIKNLNCDKIDYICQMDSDSELEPHFLERTYGGMEASPEIGALSSCFEGKKKLLEKKKIIYLLQNFEYIKYHNSQIMKQVSVISGTGNLLRIDALQEIEREFGMVWDIHSIVEDYTLTIRLKMLNWATLKSTKFIVYTDLMPSIKLLIYQRLRWQRGTFDTLFKHGINKTTIREYLKEIKYFSMTAIEIGIYFVLVNGVVYYDFGNLSIIYFAIPLVIISIYNLYYLRDYQLINILLVICFLPIVLYNLLRTFWWMWSLLTVRTKKWSE